MNVKRALRKGWALSALAHRYLYKDPIALVYSKEQGQLLAQIRWKTDQHYLRAERRRAERLALTRSTLPGDRVWFGRKGLLG